MIDKTGNGLLKAGKEFLLQKNYFEAMHCAEQIITDNENDLEAQYMLSACLLHLKRYEAAIECAENILNKKPDFVWAYLTLAYCAQKRFEYTKVILLVNKALDLIYNHKLTISIVSELYNIKGSAHLAIGETQTAAECYYQAAFYGTNEQIQREEYSNFLFTLNYVPNIIEDKVFEQIQEYKYRNSQIVQFKHNKRYSYDKLRIGYISPDLRMHPVAFFVRPLLEKYNRDRFEVYCYANNAEDGVSAEFKQAVDCWRNIKDMPADKAAQQIYDDGIDILFDLSGHTAHNCLPILAYKPAPVQITGIGYFNSTGLESVDYFLTDKYCDPAGMNDEMFTEKLLMLPHSHFCYVPGNTFPQCAESAPVMRTGHITFGCFNNYAKLTDELLLVWKRLLERVLGSRLVLKNRLFDGGEGRSIVSERLSKLGFPMDRIELRQSSNDYLEQYTNDIDIALDTYPYQGGATTCEALYMGVPVVSLIGQRHGSRFGYSLLMNAGLDMLTAASWDEYIERAVYLAGDRENLNWLHCNLRNIMEQSALMNQQQYVGEVEAAYELIWQEYCEKISL